MKRFTQPGNNVFFSFHSFATVSQQGIIALLLRVDSAEIRFLGTKRKEKLSKLRKKAYRRETSKYPRDRAYSEQK